MEEQAYYRLMDTQGGNTEQNDRHLLVNCAGCCILTKPFTTYSLSGREDYYLQYLFKGEMDVYIDGVRNVMRQGQVIAYYPHTEYHYAMQGLGEVDYLWVHFTGYGAGELMRDCDIANKTPIDIGISDTLILGFESLFREFIARDCCFNQSSAARLTAICVEIKRRADKSLTGGASGMDGRIYRSLMYIHKNYNASLSVEYLARLEHLSVSRFRVLFKKATGLSPLEYLVALRINHSRELILQTDLSMKEIACAVGYPDQLYFSQIFRDRTGMTPTAYKCAGR